MSSLGGESQGLRSDHSSALTCASGSRLLVQFARVGYRVLAFDFRGFEDDDFVGAAAALRRAGATKIFLFGASRGGTAAIVAGVRMQPDVAGVVSLSGPAEFGSLAALPAVRELTVPLLLVVGHQERPELIDDARKLYGEAPGPDKRLELVGSYRHGTSLLLPPTGAFVRPLLLNFVGSH